MLNINFFIQSYILAQKLEKEEAKKFFKYFKTEISLYFDEIIVVFRFPLVLFVNISRLIFRLPN